MKNKEAEPYRTVEITSKPTDQAHGLTITEARRRAFEASDKARQAQIVYAEEEAKRWYDYRVEE